MNIRPRKSLVQGLILAPICLLGLSGVSWGAQFWLRAETLTKTMPDASVITMWGFAQCTNGTYAVCTPATVPGPRLTVPVGDPVLTINLRNNLTGPYVEPVSLVIPGLTPAAAMTPVKFTDPDGRDRVSSFAATTPANNSTTVTYSWTAKPGTYLYESGSHPAVQVQMGLYGAVTNDAAAGQAYGPSSAYDAETVLFFSEIDPVLHGHVAAGTYGALPPAGITSTIDYEPKYFLINGAPFDSGAPTDTPTGLAGQNVLLRFLSASLKQRVPTINGLNMTVLAEDGNLYPYSKEQYSLLLSPGKTMDALVSPSDGGQYSLYDRRLGVTNNGTSSGGMFANLDVGKVMYFSTTVDTPVPGVAPNPGGTAYDDADIYSWDGVAFHRVFRARAAGLPTSANLDALKVIDADTFYMSFSRNAGTTVPTLGVVPDESVVLYDAGTWSLFFDGSDVGLSDGGNDEDVDAFDILSDGSVLISTVGTGSVPGFSSSMPDEDLMRCVGTFGPTTTCTSWRRYFDGSDVGLTTTNEDVDGVAVLDTGDIYLSTLSAFAVTGLAGGGEDIFVCNSPSPGTLTVCTSFSSFFDGSANGLPADSIDAFDIH